ncbi:MAG: hypothetical protein ACIAXF_07470 [Phycisphaerales bacterium JB063]
MSILGIVFTAVGSVMVLANKVIPAADSVHAAGIEQSRALTRVIEDIQVARYIIESSAHSVTVVVDDRTGDGLPDRLSYAWSGTPGDPLTHSINGSEPMAIARGVQDFTLRYATDTRIDSVHGGQARMGEEVLLYSYDSPVYWGVRELSSNTSGIGQYVVPSLPEEASSYSVSRVRFSAKKVGQANGETYVRLYDTSGSAPAGTALAEEVLLESDLSASFAWVDVTFANPVTRLAGDPIAVAFEWKSDTYSAGIQFDEGGPGSGLLTRNKDTDPWVSTGGKNLLIEVYGSYDSPTPSITLSRQILTQAEVTLQVGDASAQQVAARMYREPGVLSAVWDAGFEASPVGIDLNGDGADWAAQSGGAAGSFGDGRWSVDGLLYSQSAYAFAKPMMIDLTLGASASSRGGAVFQINADQVGGQAAAIIVRAGRDVTGSHYVQVFDDDAQLTPKVQVDGLGDNLPRVRLLIAPDDDAVGVIVNGVPAGTFVYTPTGGGGLPGYATISEAADGVFDLVSIQVGGRATVTQAGAGAGSDGETEEEDSGEGVILNLDLGILKLSVGAVESRGNGK